MSTLTSLRLHPFKSYLDAAIPLEPLTIIIGRNASGKSNALDALEVLNRLARGLEVRDALEGRVDGLPSVRGGALGAPPAGSPDKVFRLTTEVRDDQLGLLTHEIAISTDPQPRVIEERLTQSPARGKVRTLVESVAQPDIYRWDIDARIESGRRGTNPRFTYSSAQLICFQVAQRLEPSSAMRREVIGASRAVLQSLLGIFHLDPVPSLMRAYVPEKDVDLRRDASNVSAALYALQQTIPSGHEGQADDEESKLSLGRITKVVSNLPEHPIDGFRFVRTDLGDVMVVLNESFAGRAEQIPARQMSDGMLRMMAITTAVLAGGRNLDTSRGRGEAPADTTILIEELENGLHPTQAENLLELLLTRSGQERLVVTTHSPALLNVLPGPLHRGVLVVSRDSQTGVSAIDRLVDLPGYQRALATDRLGSLVESGRISEAYKTPTIEANSLAEILAAL